MATPKTASNDDITLQSSGWSDSDKRHSLLARKRFNLNLNRVEFCKDYSILCAKCAILCHSEHA